MATVTRVICECDNCKALEAPHHVEFVINGEETYKALDLCDKCKRAYDKATSKWFTIAYVPLVMPSPEPTRRRSRAKAKVDA